MDILIPHSWLKDFLKTDATPEKIAETGSLCGPSIERITETDKDKVYSIEVTTNRPDTASVYGTAREMAAILPRFDIKTVLIPPVLKSEQKLTDKVNYLDVHVDKKLCPRFTAILIRNIDVKDSPEYIQTRLKLLGLRPINNVVDISNYLMHELGQPVHTFDYDKIIGAKMILRQSKKGEKMITLDGKIHELPGEDIVIEDGSGKIIDLCGLMGGENSAIDTKTKNVLLFVQTYNPLNIRRTSMKLAVHTEAASLFEKNLDPENVEITIRRGIDLFTEITGGTPESEILDLYPEPYKTKKVKTTINFINERLGTTISKKDISDILESLSFKTFWQEDDLTVEIPSWRARDISIPEDILEEIARLFGYYNLPSVLMPGLIPDPLVYSPFNFEKKIKQILKGWGGAEIYTISATSKAKADFAENPAWIVKIKNPLGVDSEYMRLSLGPSLVDAAKYNTSEKIPFYLYEIANVYLPTRGELPEERMMLGIIFANYSYVNAKGIVEGLLNELNINSRFETENSHGFSTNQRSKIISGDKDIGQFGNISENLYYADFDLQTLQKISNLFAEYKPIPKYPPQIEDMTFVWPDKTYVGTVMETIKKVDKQITNIQFVGEYENSKTFRVYYQNEEKTLTDEEVKNLRNKILEELKDKYSIELK